MEEINKNKQKYDIESIDLYKELYFRELDRKKDLEGLLNTPLVVYSFIVTINYLTLNNLTERNTDIFLIYNSLIVLLMLLLSIFFLLLFYNNLFTSYTYVELSSTTDLLELEQSLIEEQDTYALAEVHFYQRMKYFYSTYTGANFAINVKRLLYYSHCKYFLILCMLFTIINVIYILLQYGKI